MKGKKREVIRISDTEYADGRIVLLEPSGEAEKDIVQQYVDGELSQEMQQAVRLAARISRGLIDAFDKIEISWIGDAIMKMATALGKPLPDSLCVPDVTKGFRRPLLNAIYKAVWKGRIKTEGDNEFGED